MSVFTGYVIAGFGALFGAALLAISLLQPQVFAGMRSMAVDAGSGVGEAGASARVNSQGFFEAIKGYYKAGSKNAELQRELEVARIELAEARSVEQENKRLRALLDLPEGENEPVATARIIGSTSSSARRFAYISVGAAHGVESGMPVVSPKGLIGRVLEVGDESARVILLTDTESTIPVRRAKDDVVAFAEGRADGSLRLRLINLGINPIKKGDVFVTSGAGGLFPPNIAVAMVTEVTDDGAIARVLSNPAATDYVSVRPIWQADLLPADLADEDAELPGE
ncbi:rod shape-determining protein MreC [Paraurantiacibacter namhicola]|uniref:Cell shape-determining protein MreC n=1 Tax=Paraurantiacibacter namhicola TaxID=645517 RepID=A0A1C7D9E6_9SPHN|nr:rod shape-determining protein MreC [Paraurantiacibacter namhicola]ANU07941.1 Cell shape-determining protein MreC [Paraurantiacibacter namhicola]